MASDKPLEKTSNPRTLISDLMKEESQSPSEISSLTQGLESISNEINSIKIKTLGENEEEIVDSCCKTPTGSIFDPFRPGPEELACAPRKNFSRDVQIPYRRQLSFDLSLFPISNLNSKFEDVENEDRFIEEVCKSFIDLIISNVMDEVCNEGFVTPKKGGFLTGLLDTCPDAPMRSGLKNKRLNLNMEGLCRNLEFEFDLV